METAPSLDPALILPTELFCKHYTPDQYQLLSEDKVKQQTHLHWSGCWEWSGAWSCGWVSACTQTLHQDSHLGLMSL